VHTINSKVAYACILELLKKYPHHLILNIRLGISTNSQKLK